MKPFATALAVLAMVTLAFACSTSPSTRWTGRCEEVGDYVLGAVEIEHKGVSEDFDAKYAQSHGISVRNNTFYFDRDSGSNDAQNPSLADQKEALGRQAYAVELTGKSIELVERQDELLEAEEEPLSAPARPPAPVPDIARPLPNPAGCVTLHPLIGLGPSTRPLPLWPLSERRPDERIRTLGT